MFNKYPINLVRSNNLIKRVQKEFYEGYTSWIKQFKEQITSKNSTYLNICIDGTHGSDFQMSIRIIVEQLKNDGYTPIPISTYDYLKSGITLRTQFHSNITNNRAFGYISEGGIADYFAIDAKKQYKEDYRKVLQESNNRLVFITFGPGAFWLGDEDFHLSYFLDVSREYQQVQHQKELLNFGLSWNQDKTEKYKICYFLEWPILENYRKQYIDQFDFYVDLNNPDSPKVINTSLLNNVLEEISHNPLRVKPFFAPGIWGGQYLKKLADLPQDWENCAWSFEPIAPENSILIGLNEKVIEVPFLIMMAKQYRSILGDRLVGLFGDYFPIRFDYLDTMEGTNLSCQVHPKQSYVEEQFNDLLEQQESYYILDSKEDSKVYLGLTDKASKDSLYNVVKNTQENLQPFEISDYVNEWEASNGDLFLIPTGTVHCSGRNNLVLEISSTTWWLTFKIYDYLRKDKDGKPRPINLNHAFNNIDFHKDTEWVQNHLMQSPQLLKEQGEGNQEFCLGKRDDLLFYVNRIHLDDMWEDHTHNELVLVNLVEGEKVLIYSSEDESINVELSFAESYIIPAQFGHFSIKNLGEQPCKIIKAGVSENWTTSINKDVLS